MVCLLNSCLYVMFRSCLESLASVVPIKLVRSAHCGAPRIAVRRALRHTVHTWAVVGKNDWQFSNPRIDTASKVLLLLTNILLALQLLLYIQIKAGTHYYKPLLPWT